MTKGMLMEAMASISKAGFKNLMSSLCYLFPLYNDVHVKFEIYKNLDSYKNPRSPYHRFVGQLLRIARQLVYDLNLNKRNLIVIFY